MNHNTNTNNNSASNVVTEQNGGMTRVSFGQPPASEAPSAAPYEANRVSTGPIRLNMHTWEVSQGGAARYSTGQDRSNTSVAATLQRVNGADTVELIPGVAGTRTHIRQAVQDGLIEPVGNGQYRDRGNSQAPAPGSTNESTSTPASQEPDEQSSLPPVDAGFGVFDAEETADWDAAIEPLPQHAYDAASASVVTSILTGSDSLDKAALNLAEQAGMDTGLAAQFVNEGYAMYERIVATETAAMGVTDKPAFYAWLRDSKQKPLQAAMQSLTAQRDVQPFRTLAIEYGRYTSEQARNMRQ